MEYKHSDLTSAIIGAFYDVYNELGYGFLEKVYENALAYELNKRGLSIQQQAPIKVYYDELLVGQYFADLLVEDAIIIELKAAEGIAEEHEAQLLNYLKATEIDIGLILNFGPKPQVMRKVFETARVKVPHR
jgi:GxxExxY protein